MEGEEVSKDPKHGEPDKEMRCGVTLSTWKTVSGIILVILIALSWVGATQFATSTYTPDYNAPFFTTWFSNVWLSTVYLMFLVPSLASGQKLQDIVRDSMLVFGKPEQRKIAKTLSIVSFFGTVSIVTNYLFIRALGIIASADVTAIFSSSNAFVYIFSIIWLRENFSFIRTFAVCFSVIGIILISYAEGFGGANAVGVTLTVISALGAALYQVLFKCVIRDASGRQVALFLSLVGAFQIFILWPITLTFWLTNYELIRGGHIPWSYLCGSGILALVFNFLVNFGIAFTFPLFISLGTVTGIPTNALADFIFRGKDFGPYKIAAALLIVTGFLLMLVPLSYEHDFVKRFCCFDPPISCRRLDHEENGKSGCVEVQGEELKATQGPNELC